MFSAKRIKPEWYSGEMDEAIGGGIECRDKERTLADKIRGKWTEENDGRNGIPG